MANKEQLSILKKGAGVWNGWRAKNIYVYANINEADLDGADLSGVDLRIAHLRRANLSQVDLSGANLSGANLSDANLWEANLSESNLTKANLNGANLSSAFIKGANLAQANLMAASLRNANIQNASMGEANLMLAQLGGADLSGANLRHANLTRAQLSGVSLRQADLSETRLRRANLTKANLVEVKFSGADLVGTNLSEAKVGNTVFANSDLSRAVGLESVDHLGPSYISIDTFMLSEGKIPDAFLRGCGLSDADIEYAKLSNPSLGAEEINKILHKIHHIRETQAIQISPLFIVYSHEDGKFVDKISSCLKDKGIRYWRNAHGMKTGWMEKPMERNVRQNPKVLLILSEHTMQSNWVEHEARAARELEQEIGQDVLRLVVLDKNWKERRWAKQMMEQIKESNILDFFAWKDNRKFDGTFHTLIEGLELFYKG